MALTDSDAWPALGEMTRHGIALEVGRLMRRASYREAAHGPEAFDCYGLAWWVQRVCFARDLPLIRATGSPAALARALATHTAREAWLPIEAPSHGCMVEMSGTRYPHHLGVWLDIDRGGVLHIQETGVLFQSLAVIRATGWRTGFFAHRDQDTP